MEYEVGVVTMQKEKTLFGVNSYQQIMLLFICFSKGIAKRWITLLFICFSKGIAKRLIIFVDKLNSNSSILIGPKNYNSNSRIGTDH